jgi:hypothetical protein
MAAWFSSICANLEKLSTSSVERAFCLPHGPGIAHPAQQNLDRSRLGSRRAGLDPKHMAALSAAASRICRQFGPARYLKFSYVIVKPA